jgi:hypothetical protein
MSNNDDFVIKQYHCRLCNDTHEIQLRKTLINNQSKFPFSHSFLHGELKNILTILYLDRNLEIRGVDVQKLRDDDIFSKEQVISISATLMEEIERLRRENDALQRELKNLKLKRNNLPI